MRIFFFLLLILFKTISLEAQSLNIDSLRNLLNIAREDTARVMLLIQLGSAYQYSNPDSALSYDMQGLNLAQKIKYSRGELFCRVGLAGYWWSIGDYATTVKLLLPEVHNVESTKDQELVITTFAFLANSYRDQGDFTEALHYQFKLENYAGKYSNCKYCKINNAAIAFLYLLKNQLDSAHFYLRKAFTYPPEAGFEGWIYFAAGRIYTERKSYDSAFLYYRKSVQMLIDENNLKDLAGVYNSMSTVFKMAGLPDSTIFYARRALNVAQLKRFAKETMEASLLLSKAYDPINTDSALHYYKQAMAAKDSLYSQEKQRQIVSYKFNEQLRQLDIQQAQEQLRNKIKMYSLLAVLGVFLIIAFILYRNNKQKQKAKIKIEKAYDELKATQAQLIQSAKMASLGELTAGIAHEIQNPLNFVNNFSEVNTELIDEANLEIDKGNTNEVKTILNDIKENEQKINHHGKRADAIVKGMLQHSKASTGKKEPTNINALADEYLRLAYHGLRAKDKNFTAEMKTEFDEVIGNINIIPQDIGRVLLNLYNNAFYAITEKKNASTNSAEQQYEPTVSVSTKKINDKIVIKVKDNGNGVPQKVVDKIFQPFFTTKPTGQGTGLGLSLSYDIIKAHGGEIKVETKEGEGSEFIITLTY